MIYVPTLLHGSIIIKKKFGLCIGSWIHLTVPNLTFKRRLIWRLSLRCNACKMTSLAILPVNQCRVSGNAVLVEKDVS